MPSFSQEQRLAIAIGIPTLALLFFLWYRRRQNFDDDDDDDEQESAVATVFETKFEVKIPQYLVGTVIGRAGANIKQIQKESGAYLRLKDDEDEEETVEDFDQSKPVSETEKTRTVIIKGEREKARKAEFLIKKIINDQPKIFTEEHFIPQKSCGRIIGRGGMTIRHLCKVSGARITISREDLHSDEPRKCIINGTTDQIANAKGLLDEKVAEHEQSMARRPAHQISRYQGKEFERPVQPCKSNQVSSFPSSVQFPNTSDYIEVFVSAIDTPSHFYIQLVRTGDAQKLDQLIDTLTDEASAGSAEDMIDSIEVGAICSAPFVQDDSRYRAKVTQINSDGTVGLYYVDYGDYGTVPKYKLRKIRKEHLQLPFQAIECYLANTRPKDDNWTEQASNDFQDLTYYPNWVGLMAKTVKYCGDIPCLDLYDTTTTQDIYINGEMVKRGFALEDASFPPQPLQPKVGEEKPVVSEAKPSTETNLNKDGAKSAISEATPLTKAELFTVSSPAIDEEDTGKDLDLRSPATPKEFSPIKNALVKRVSKDYIDTSSVAKNTEKKPAIGVVAEENAKPEAVQETLVPTETHSQVKSVPEAGFLADVESIPEVESTPEVNIPIESSKSGVDLSTSGSPKLSASQVLKPEVREMIQMEVSQAFETQLPPEELFTQSLINERTDVDLQSSNEDIPKHQQAESTRSDSGIELTHDEDVKNVESTLSVTVDSHNQPLVTETMVTPPLDKHDDDDDDDDGDDDDDDDNLETFTTSFTKQVQTKKTFVSSVTVTSNHSKPSTVTLVPSSEKKDGVIESVTSQSSKRSYAQAVRTSQEYDSKDWTGSEGEHLTGSQDPGNHGNNVVVQRIEIQSKPDENTVFELQREAKSMTSSTEDGTLTTIASIQQQTCQTSTHVTQSTNHKQLPNGQLEMERKEVLLKLDRTSPVDSDSEAYVSALDDLASDTDTTSFYDTAADHISSSTTSLDYLGNDTDTDTLKPHTEDPGTPVNTDSDDDDDDDEYDSDDEDSGDKTPRKRSLDLDEAVTPTASGSIKLAAKCLSELDLGYRGDSEDVTDSKEDLR